MPQTPWAIHLSSAAAADTISAQSPWACDVHVLGRSSSDQAGGRSGRLVAVTCRIDVRDAESSRDLTPAVFDLIARQNACLLVELFSSDQYDRPSAPRAMPAAAAKVVQIAKAASAHGVPVALSPRRGHWLERIEDAVRVAMRVNRRDVGVAFNIADWQAVETRPDLLPEHIKLALPKLLAVTCTGRRDGVGGHACLTLHGDPLDIQPILRLLAQGGYRGPFILQPV